MGLVGPREIGLAEAKPKYGRPRHNRETEHGNDGISKKLVKATRNGEQTSPNRLQDNRVGGSLVGRMDRGRSLKE